MFEIAKSTIKKMFNACIVIIVVMNFHKNVSIVKFFPSKFPGILANIFRRKIISVYNMYQKHLLLFCFISERY